VNKVKASKKKKKATVAESNTSVMHLYKDAEPIPVKGRGGAKVDPLMDLVSVNTYLRSHPEKNLDKDRSGDAQPLAVCQTRS
jgi:hypothetical protein